MKHTYRFNHPEYDYRDAVNYDGKSYYNPPMSIVIDSTTFIVPFGTHDAKHVKFDGDTAIIVNSNESLDYIGMMVIDLKDNSVTDCYLSGNDINDSNSPAYGIFDLDFENQIKVLENYLPL